MRRLLWIVIFIASAWLLQSQLDPSMDLSDDSSKPDTAEIAEQSRREADALEQAYQQRSSGMQLRGTGTVTNLLPDDDDGSRHQRFILKLPSGRTLLIAHNIDVATRVVNLSEGDTVSFYGQYEWNEKGGVIHWTHNDPHGSHTAGWLKHNGETYQ